MKRLGNLGFILLFVLVGCMSSQEAITVSTAPMTNLFSKQYPSTDPQVSKLLDTYRKMGDLKHFNTDQDRYAKNIISWQMPHGGFGLHDASFYEAPWDGEKSRSEWKSKGRELGNFDDYATVAEIRFLAMVFTQTSDSVLKAQIKASIERGLQFIFMSQYTNGGWPQVYPKRYKNSYSNNVTLNDDAMIRTMVLLSDILASLPPFHEDLVAPATRERIYPRLASAVSYLLNAQIRNDNVLTIWSSQYYPSSFSPAPARSYELVSKSGKESVGVLAFLMNWPDQSESVKASVAGGVAWYQSNKVENLVLREGEFSEEIGAELWYRFYDVNSNIPFFAGRDGIKKYDLASIEEERRKGYSWGSNYASKVLKTAPRYFEKLAQN